MPTTASSSLPPSVRDHFQTQWNTHLAEHVAELARGWFAEDLGQECDWTSVALVEADAGATLDVVARKPGVIAGLEAAGIVARTADPRLEWRPRLADGSTVAAGEVVATLGGATRSVLAAERVVLNVVGRMSGVATATRRLVDAVAGTPCRVYDTRKTVPGWRLLDKLAVRLGGGWNHRLGLFDAILIKDNHLAAVATQGGPAGPIAGMSAAGQPGGEAASPAAAVRRARAFLAATFPPARAEGMVVEIELDSLDALAAVLEAGPDIVLLDNMARAQLAEAVALRNRLKSRVILEASGGIRPETVAAIAATGVDRVSTGWPTHDAPWLDVALDWAAVGGGRP
jgi:nicotinate-nucleotide pyrophosphorylase (carboxylating)